MTTVCGEFGQRGGGRTRCNSSSISDFPTKINPNWLPYLKNCHVSELAPQSEITPGDGMLGMGVYRTTYVMKTWIDFMQNNIPDHLTNIFIFLAVSHTCFYKSVCGKKSYWNKVRNFAQGDFALHVCFISNTRLKFDWNVRLFSKLLLF